MRKLAFRTLGLLALLGFTAFLFLSITGSASDLSSLPRIEEPLLLAPALMAQAATVALYVALWRTLMASIDPARPSWIESSAAFICSWLARHAPTGVPYIAGKVVLGERIGHGRTAVIASMLYENLFVVCAFAASSCAVLALYSVALPGVLWLAIGTTTAGVLSVIPSPLARRLFERLSQRVTRLQSLRACSLSGRTTARAAVVALAAALLNGLAFALLLNAFTELSAGEMIIAGAAFNLAGAAGVAAVPVPSGIGVREAVLIGLLQTVVPLEIATAAAVLSRAAGMCLDIALGLAGAGIFAARAKYRRPSGVVSYSPSPLSSHPH